MPELPEVERARLLARGVAEGRVIEDVVCASDPIVFEGVTPRVMRSSLRGRRVIKVHRRGKQLWFELDRSPHPLFHFGMSGMFRTPGDAPIRYRSSGNKPPDMSWPPRWTKIRLIFDDGSELAMTDKRRFGRIRLRTDPPREPPISELGFDPLLDLPTPNRFADMLRSRRAPVKAVLLDQSFAAGVGNWIADEVLYQARIDPRRRAAELSDREARSVRSTLKRVIEVAVRFNAEKAKFPKTWLFHHRWGKNSQARTSREKIEHIVVGGRTTAWTPGAQR